jgi:hypothetical protein
MALAELWIDRAARYATRDECFYNELLELSPATVGRVSLFHTAAGVSCVEGLIAIGLADSARLTGAVARFVTRSKGATALALLAYIELSSLSSQVGAEQHRTLHPGHRPTYTDHCAGGIGPSVFVDRVE